MSGFGLKRSGMRQRIAAYLISFFAVWGTAVCLFVPSSHAMDRAEGEKLFSQAVQAYKDGHFNEAVDLDEKILAADLESPAVYYNLGNAYLRDKKLGKAIVNYLRAERLSPRDADIRANLAFARNNVENYQSFPSAGAVRLLNFQRISTGELKWISLVFFMVAGIFFLAGSAAGMRTRRLVLWTVLLSLVWVYFSAAMAVKSTREAGYAVIVQSAEIKYEPSKDATTYFKLSEGAEVRILRMEDGWVKIERPDGKIGWAPRDSVEKISR